MEGDLGQTKAGPLWVRDTGAGPPLLLLHGILASGGVFDHLASRVTGRFRVLSPDLRGHGSGGRLPGPLDAGAVASDLAPMLDALGIERAHLLGHSHGGAAAQVFARAHPDRVRSLILVGTYTLLRLTPWEKLLALVSPPVVSAIGTDRLARLVRLTRPGCGGRRLTPEAARVLAAAAASSDGDRMAEAIRAARPFDSREWLGEIRARTLVVTGDADLIVAPRQGPLLASGIPDARIRVLPGGGHQLPLSHPDDLAGLVAAWIGEDDDVAGPPSP